MDQCVIVTTVEQAKKKETDISQEDRDLLQEIYEKLVDGSMTLPVGDQKNVTRMQRQREYVDAFLEALYESKENDPQFLVSTYEQVTPYIVTDCTANTLSSMLDLYTDHAINEAVTPEGENLIIDGYYQFHADEENMDALILELFYRPKK